MDIDLRKILQDTVTLSTDKKLELATESFNAMIPELRQKFTGNEILKFMTAVFSAAVTADGKLSSEEFSLVKSFYDIVGINLSNEETLQLIVEVNKSGAAYELVEQLLKNLSAEGQNHLLSLIITICAIDDTISYKEVEYLSDLFNA